MLARSKLCLREAGRDFPKSLGIFDRSLTPLPPLRAAPGQKSRRLFDCFDSFQGSRARAPARTAPKNPVLVIETGYGAALRERASRDLAAPTYFALF